MTDPSTGPATSGARIEDRAATAALLARHDRAGPRYTSYPTAVEFDERVGAEEYEQRLLAADGRGDEPLSVYVHLPFCSERCLFCGCHVVITPHKERAAPYLELLTREIDLVAARLPHRRRISQLHLGGGTPTYYEPAQLDRLLTHLFTHFEAVPGAELAVECDPRVTTAAHIAALADHGFNRISFGVQDFAPAVQEAIGRIQTVAQTRDLIACARGHGFTGINVDLIYGLPKQDLVGFEETVETVIGLDPDRVALYSFAYVPWMRRHQKRLEQTAFPDRETKFALFGMARERFLGAGYDPIGMDHFAKPADDLAQARREHRLRRNFQGYAVMPADDVIGLGISAIGDVRGAYIQNVKKLSDYEAALDAGRLPTERGFVLQGQDAMRRDLIHELMCNFRVDKHAFAARHCIDFDTAFAADLERLADLEASGLAVVDDDAIAATPVGELFVRNLAMCFDTYWREKHEDAGTSIFSRTV